MDYLSRTTKSIKSTGEKIFNWGIPAFRSESGFVTCPSAGKCAKGCYAQQNFYLYGYVKKKYESRLELSQNIWFVPTLSLEIKKKKVKVLRVHDSGDFYSLEYACDWARIMMLNPQTRFYSYTKQIPLVKRLEWPSNMTFIFSLGGKWDHQVDLDKDRHSQVFLNQNQLRQEGYADASTDDSVAFLSDNHKIGLLYHGHANRAFRT